MNKAELVDALAEHLGDRRTATAAVDGVLHTVMRTVHSSERVALSGFGVFEPRERAARTARNPRTGEAVQVARTTVPVFRAGTTFRDVVGGTRELPGLAPVPAPVSTSNGAGPVAPGGPAAGELLDDEVAAAGPVGPGVGSDLGPPSDTAPGKDPAKGTSGKKSAKGTSAKDPAKGTSAKKSAKGTSAKKSAKGTSGKKSAKGTSAKK